MIHSIILAGIRDCWTETDLISWSCWATGGITMLTYFVSTRGIENAAAEELIKQLSDEGLFRLRNPEKPKASVLKYEDESGNEFFSINIPVGTEDETWLDGGRMYPYAFLNHTTAGREHQPEMRRL